MDHPAPSLQPTGEKQEMAAASPSRWRFYKSRVKYADYFLPTNLISTFEYRHWARTENSTCSPGATAMVGNQTNFALWPAGGAGGLQFTKRQRCRGNADGPDRRFAFIAFRHQGAVVAVWCDLIFSAQAVPAAGTSQRRF